MLKVMIVDDEMIVRVGFSSCMDWEEHGCRVTATCQSAREAIAAFGREIPDIVFTDIMMPEMDGIALVEYIRAHYPKTRVVVLSCVNEIESVKRAMKLGAEDYILKLSFTREALEQVIDGLRQAIEAEREKEGERELKVYSASREEDLRLLALEQEGDGQEVILERLGYMYDPFASYRAACLVVDSPRTAWAQRGQDAHIRRYGLLNMIREYFGGIAGLDLAFAGEWEMIAVFTGKEGGMEEPVFSEALGQLNRALKTHLDVTVTMGLGPACRDRMKIGESFQQARRLAALRFFDGGASFHSREMPGGGKAPDGAETRRRIREACLKQDEEEAARLVRVWCRELAGERRFEQIGATRQAVAKAWLYVCGQWPLEETLGPALDEFLQAETLRELEECFLKALFGLLGRLRHRRAVSPEIGGLLCWLEEHVEDTVSLEEAAGRCALGKSQFCTLFKKATGDTFVNYFNGLKMKRAYGLLSSGHLQVQEAAEQIGIHDLSYFSRLFKKYYNISPSDLKKI